MGKKVAILLLTMMILIGFSGWYIVGGIQAYARYKQSGIAYQEHCGGQTPVHICVQSPSELFSAYYPSYTAAQANLFHVQFSSSRSITLVMSVSIADFARADTRTVNATPTIQSMSFMPLVMNQALRQWTIDKHTWVRVQVTDTQGHLYYDDDSALLMHSRWLMQWIAVNRLKIAAWVTPDDPAVMDLDRKAEALLKNPPTAMIGYAKGASVLAVRDQVDAIFDALRLDYHMRYSSESIPNSSPGDTSVAPQTIKLPAEVLQQGSGMCIELTALLASAVERIGLHSEIVIIPGHAFLGVAVTPNDAHFEYWDAVQVNDGIAGDSANVWADKEYIQNAHQIVDTILISEARQEGVGPML